MSRFEGLSGHVEFDHATGLRNNLTLSIVDKTKTGVDLVIVNGNLNFILINKKNFSKVGYWRDNIVQNKKSIEIVRSYAKEKDQVYDKLSRHLKVTTKLVFYLKNQSNNF